MRTTNSSSTGDTEILTFLIADVRGYTLFTQQRGDEAAAKLAARFAEIAREIVEVRGGSVIELRGDEALAVFSSARQAIRASVELQERFVEETLADPELPLPVGIGLDTGEAVPVEGGYRGGALNLAARLCGQAKAGEVLASQGVVHVARKVDGVRYVERGKVALKNLPEPVAFVAVLPEGDDPAERMKAIRTPTKSVAGPRRQSARLAVTIAVVVAAVAVAIPLIRSGAGGDVTIRAGSIALLDGGRLLTQAIVGDQPRGVAAGAGATWVTEAASGSLVRIDLGTGQIVERVAVGAGPTGVAVAADHVWVANTDERTVSEVNPDTNTVVNAVDVGNGPAGMAADGSTLWVANSVDATVVSIDAATGSILATVRVGARPLGVAIGGDAVWVTSRDTDSVMRVSPGTDRVVQTIRVGNEPEAIAWGAGAVWVANRADRTVSRIDPESGAVTSTTAVSGDPAALAALEDEVWVADASGRALVRLDPVTAEVRQTVEIGSSPVALAAQGERLWIAARASLATHRGGTLKVVGGYGALTTDPSVFDTLTSNAITLTNDGLVGLRRAAGVGGTTLVPDLAADLPLIEDGGATFTFRLREGIVFSDGHELVASDVRASFERLMQGEFGDWNDAVRNIVGGDRCSPDGCDLSEGVLADDAAGTVTIHLREPDPDFLLKLVPPTYAILPAGTPVQLGTTPAPATGPYMIASIDPGVELVLERNPTFREWSADAQPEGFVDRIVFQAGLDPDEQVDAVEAGEADATTDPIPLARLEEVATRYTGQMLQTPIAALGAVFLNTERPPFDDVRARRAVAFALDREEIASSQDQLAIPEFRITCQLLPPNLLGYVPTCPFSSDGRTWDGPDLSEARRLVEASGTEGMPVEVWIYPELSGVGDGLGSALDDIGYRASIRILEVDKFNYYTQAAAPDATIQAGYQGWGAGYPAPGQFLEVLQACAREGEYSFNLSRLCDRRIDRDIRQAYLQQLSDPAAAAALWASVDARLAQLAAVIPLSNPVATVLVSERVGNAQMHPYIGPLLSHLWVR